MNEGIEGVFLGTGTVKRIIIVILVKARSLEVQYNYWFLFGRVNSFH
jgi:hypothetical protein